MTTIILALFWKAWPFIAAGVAALAWGFRQRRAGAASERAKQAAAEKKARDVADDVENDVGAMTPEQRREALRRYARD